METAHHDLMQLAGSQSLGERHATAASGGRLGRILVIGGQGFVGKHLVPALAAAGWDVLSTGLRPVASNGSARTASLDIRDASATRALLEAFNPAAVINLAGHGFHRDVAAVMAVHRDGQESVVAAVNAVRSVRRCIFCSSELVKNVESQEPAEAFGAGLQPERRYALCHLGGERAVRERLRDGVAWTIVRPTSIWGPFCAGPFLKFFLAIARRRYWHLGGPDPWRRMSYVGNTAFQICQVLDAAESLVHGQVFYLGDYEPLTVRRWAEAFARAFGVPLPRTLPRPLVATAAKVGDVLWHLGMDDPPLTTRRLRNIRRAKMDLPLETMMSLAPCLPYTLEAGVASTVRWLAEEGLLPRRMAQALLAAQSGGSSEKEGSPCGCA